MKLLLADDHTLFRDALVQYIERSNPDAKVAIAEDFYQAYREMEENNDQDLILLDLRMPGMNGMDGFRKIREQFPDTPVALMSGIAEPEDVREAMDLGAAGYFPKTLSGKALLKGIEAVLNGEIFMPMDSAKPATPMPSYYGESSPVPSYVEINESHQASSKQDDEFSLTPRENDVLEYLVTGSSNKEIASALGLQVVTVKLHVRGICRKLGAKNRTQAALIAREHGLAKEVATGTR